ncbi:MAG: hypothetical protein F4024_12315 [Gammaproteobacteria bacterium]|nr:hypothetical protein [Gammaproteobacteria bacterium]
MVLIIVRSPIKSSAYTTLLSFFLTLLTCTASAEMVRHSFEHNGVPREYFVFLPGTAQPQAKLPVVVGLHGYTSTATGFAAGHGLDQHAEKHGYIGVFPQGSAFRDVQGNASASASSAPLITSWNDLAANQADAAGVQHCLAERDRYPCPPDCGSCSQCMWTSCGDDLGFLHRVLEEVKAEYPTDEDRYYVLGVSNGAMMALRLGCDRSHQFAAVSAIIGQLAPGFACQPATQLPLLHLTGALDDTVREDGQPAADGFLYETAEHTRAYWAKAMQCGNLARWSPSQPEAAQLQCEAWRQCQVAGQEVVGCSDPKGAHAWPGASVGSVTATCVTAQQQASFPDQPLCPASTPEDVTDWGIDLVWDFFSRYSRQPERPPVP